MIDEESNCNDHYGQNRQSGKRFREGVFKEGLFAFFGGTSLFSGWFSFSHLCAINQGDIARSAFDLQPISGEVDRSATT